MAIMTNRPVIDWNDFTSTDFIYLSAKNICIWHFGDTEVNHSFDFMICMI